MDIESESFVSSADSQVMDALERYWGFDSLRPLQGEAIEAGVSSRDSLVVMPTGGGKSLCYQIPPLVAGRMDIVVSPLISLMKDQVDGLRQNGYPTGAIHSSMTPREREETRAMVQRGECRLLFVTPERLLSPRFLEFVRKQNVNCFAIDEAHCISQWGHDFRQEYRDLRRLREACPEASLHAYTATATPRVQQDIIDQLGLRDPSVLIGTFDRPNLVYRILPKVDVERQTLEIIRRHDGEAAIVYCLSRKDTESLAEFLRLNGVKAAAYHAGLEKPERAHTQEAFAAEELDVVVATVAFGMGIDRSNVRCVIHASIPKTIEHYQQETGRSGRDGLEAECVLLYSISDMIRWERLIEMSAADAEAPEHVVSAQKELLRHMTGLCNRAVCRHRALSEYFGQSYRKDDCGACDFCLGEVKLMGSRKAGKKTTQHGAPARSVRREEPEARLPDESESHGEPVADESESNESTVVAQKIISCVYRVTQSSGIGFGVGYINEVLRGANTQTVRSRGHENLSTYGLLRDLPEKTITNLIYQLVDQGLLERSGGDRPVLQLNDESLAILRGERDVKLIEPDSGPVHKTTIGEAAWEGVDHELFEHLRDLRKKIALGQQVPAYVVFSDATLRELAKSRPVTREHMAEINGVGKRKLEEYGERFISAIETYCDENDLTTNVEIVIRRQGGSGSARPNLQKSQAFAMFAEGASLDEVADATERAMSTVCSYLAEWIERDKPSDISAWITEDEYDRIIDAACRLGADRLKPVHEELDGEISYEAIKIALAFYAVCVEQQNG